MYRNTNSKLSKKLDHKKNINETIKNFKNHFNYPINNTWYNCDIISNDYMPIIGKIKNKLFHFNIKNGVVKIKRKK